VRQIVWIQIEGRGFHAEHFYEISKDIIDCAKNLYLTSENGSDNNSGSYVSPTGQNAFKEMGE
jgi:hypothetical protein